MTKKKIIVIALIVVTAIAAGLVLTQCGKKEDKKPETVKTEQGKKTDVEKLTEHVKNINESIKKVDTSKLEGEGKEKVEKLKAEYTEKIAKAKDEKEADKLYKEFEEKVKELSGGKVEVKESEKTDEKTGETNKPENTTQTPSNAGASTPSSSGSDAGTASQPSDSGSSGSGSGSSTPAPEQPKPKTWVVDQAAWTETINEPIYDYRPTWWIKFTDGHVETYYDEMEWYNITKTSGIGVASYGNGEDEEYISGYTTKTIEHPEVGHWE